MVYAELMIRFLDQRKAVIAHGQKNVNEGSMNNKLRIGSSRNFVVGFMAAAALVCALLLSGCASNAQQANDPQTLNRQYMANVNQIMDEIDAR